MDKVLDQLVKLTEKYAQLKQDYKKRGEKVTELNTINQRLESELTTLKYITCEKFNIKKDVLSANIKIYRLERQIGDKNSIIRHLKEKLANQNPTD